MKQVGKVADGPGPFVLHMCTYIYISELPFLFVLLPWFALHMYFYLRPTTMKKELSLQTVDSSLLMLMIIQHSKEVLLKIL
jgi:hypothetical protein